MTDPKSARPNVIVFLTDQQRWDTTGLHGNPLDLTPNLDRMAQWGTHVNFAFTPQPVCGPARSTLQTGTYASTTGCHHNRVPLAADARTLAHHFREANYATGYIGKWHLNGEVRKRDTEPVPESRRGGYEYWLASNILEFTSEPYSTTVYDNDDQPAGLPGYRVAALADAAIRYIDAQKERPFFLFASFVEPHHQNSIDDYPPPDGYRERYTSRWIPPDAAALGGTVHQHIAGYLGAVKRVDEAFGRVLDALKSLGLDKNTIVVFTSDHGCHFNTRDRGQKQTCHDASIRVPLALRGPGFDAGGRIPDLVSLIDLPPTLLDAAGLPVPEEMQGISFLPLLRGEREAWPTEAFVQITRIDGRVERCVRTQRWKYSVVAPGDEGRLLPGEDQFVESYLYDLEADPYELTNLIDLVSHQEAAAVMRERLVRRMVDAGEEKPTIVSPPLRSGGQREVRSDQALA